MKTNPPPFDWSDLQVLLQVARSGSLSRAAAAMDSSHPTLFRRVRAMEAKLGCTLFTRSKSGYQPTEAAAPLLDIAAMVEQRLNRLDGTARQRIVLGTTETLAHAVLPPILARLQARPQQQHIDLVLDDALADVRGRTVDIALRAGGTPSPDLVGRVLCKIHLAVFRPAAWNSVGEDELAAHPWVTGDDSFAHLASTRWLHENGFASRAAMRCNSMLSVLRLAESGIGLAVLPCYLGDPSPLLRRVTPILPQLHSDLWLLSSPSLRGSMHVRSLCDALADELRALAGLFEGAAARQG